MKNVMMINRLRIKYDKKADSLSEAYSVCSDWTAIGYTKIEARKIFHGGKGEFKQLPEGLGIVRFAM